MRTRLVTLVVLAIAALGGASASAQHFDGDAANGVFNPQMTATVTQTLVNRPTGFTIDITQADHEDIPIFAQLRAPDWQFDFAGTRVGETSAGVPATRCKDVMDNVGNSPNGTGTGTQTDYSKRTDAKIARAEKVGTIRLQAAADGVSRPGPPILWTGDIAFLRYDSVNHKGTMCILLITTDSRVTTLPDTNPTSGGDDIEGITEIVTDFPVQLASDGGQNYQETYANLSDLVKNSSLQTVNTSLIELGATYFAHSSGNWNPGGVDFSKSPVTSGAKPVVGLFTPCPPADPSFLKCNSNKAPVTRTIPFTWRIPTPAVSGPSGLLNTNPVSVAGSSDPGATVQIFENGSPVPGATGTADATGHWVAPTSLPDGNHTVLAKVVDVGGASPASNTTSFTLDTTPPVAPALSAPAAGAATNGTLVAFSGTAEPNADVEVIENALTIANAHTSAGGAWSATVTMVKGPHAVSVRATDVAGNVGLAGPDRSFSVTTGTPVVITPTQSGAINSINVTFNGSAEPGAVVTLDEAGTAVGSPGVAGASGVWSIGASLPEGDHTVTATAVADGFTSTVSVGRLFTIDLTPPGAATITSPVGGSTEKSMSVSVRGTSEPAASISLYEGTRKAAAGTADATGLWSITATFSDGDHTIVARIADRAGNAGLDSTPVTFTVADPLEIVTPRAGSLNAGSIVVSGASDPASSQVRLFEGPNEIARTASADGLWSATVSFASGTHSIRARAVTNGGLGAFTQPVGFRVDADAPMIVINKPWESTSAGGVLVASPVRGTARDDRGSDSGVRSIALKYVNVITGATVTRAPESCLRCPGPYVIWSDSPHMGPGLYEVTATATDGVGNTSSTTIDLILL